MAIPHRPISHSIASSLVGYLVVVRNENRFVGCLMVTDGRGQPVEFVHNSAKAPAGLLWPENEVRRVAIQSLAHSLFEGCSKSPSVLLGETELGAPTFCSEEIAPMIPFGLIGGDLGAGVENLAWTSSAPAPASAAAALVDELKRRNLLLEPFSRMRNALAEVYGGPDSE